MRRILIYRNDLLPISETFIRDQANALTHFHPCFVGLTRPPRSLDIPPDSILLTPNRSLFSRVRKRLYRMTGIAPGFHRRVGAIGAELIHAHFGPDGKTAAYLSNALGLPLIVTLHGYDVTIRSESPNTYADLGKRASLFLCVSNFIRDKAIQAGFPPEKLRVHYIGINPRRFTPGDGQRQRNSVLFVGRLVEKKGCEYLLRAMALVQKEHPGAKATIIGDGPLRPQLEALAGSLKVQCSFLGAQPHDIVREWLERARVFCVPSVTAANGDSEGLAMVFGEAQAMGVPVVTFNHGGMREIVLDGDTGLLAPEFDYEKLAEGILRYLKDDSLWQHSSSSAMNWIRKRFDIAVQTAELEDIYSQVISAAGR
jgi:colanic acid/amylovoran biosynthesis glycosyltransferase